MEAEDVVLDDCGQRKVVEESGEVLPHLGVAIFTQALVVESINLGDLLGLVVAAKNGDTVGEANLHHDKESDSLNRVVTTVNVVSHEEVICLWQRATQPK